MPPRTSLNQMVGHTAACLGTQASRAGCPADSWRASKHAGRTARNARESSAESSKGNVQAIRFSVASVWFPQSRTPSYESSAGVPPSPKESSYESSAGWWLNGRGSKKPTIRFAALCVRLSTATLVTTASKR